MTVFYGLENSITSCVWGGGGQKELDVWLDQLRSLKRDQVDNDSFCGVFLKHMNYETQHE